MCVCVCVSTLCCDGASIESAGQNGCQSQRALGQMTRFSIRKKKNIRGFSMAICLTCVRGINPLTHLILGCIFFRADSRHERFAVVTGTLSKLTQLGTTLSILGLHVRGSPFSHIKRAISLDM